MREYDEFERAYTGRSRKGLHPLAWVGIAIGTMMLLGGAVVGVGTMIFMNRVERFVETVQHNPARVAAEAISRMDPDLDVVAYDDMAGTVTVHNLRSDQVSTVDFEDIVEGELFVDQGEKDFELDVDGSLVIRTEDGRLALDLKGDEEGGTLVIETDEGETRIGAGRQAEGPPDWVPIFEELERPRRIYSASTGDGFLGAVAWETDASPERVVRFYAEWLEDEGYNVRSERYSEGSRERQGAAWGSLDDDERTVFVLAVEEDGVTKVVLNYTDQR